MPKFAADFALALELTQPLLNLVLDKFIAVLRAQNLHQYTASLGFFGSFQAELVDLSIIDIEDKPPIGGVETDVEAEADITFRPFNLFSLRTKVFISIDDVEVDSTKTPAGLPRGLVLNVRSASPVRVRFSGGFFARLLNLIVAPLVRFGTWIAFRIIRKVEIPIWELTDVFAALGIRYAQGSPLLTAQKLLPPPSLLLASDFNLTDPLRGIPNQLGHFLPAATNIGAVVHERVIAAAVQIAFQKGWVPQTFRVQKFKISINSFGVRFEQDTVVAFGKLKAKRKKCWTRVKVSITFKVAVRPHVVDVNTPNPRIDFQYDANVNVHVSTSGMLVVLGVIMFAPLFLALTIAMSFLINIVLQQFLPFKTTWSQSGLFLTIQATASFSGFVPLSMTFPLQLQGTGSYGLARFQQFQLPGGASIGVGYTQESLTVQDKELRVAVELR